MVGTGRVERGALPRLGGGLTRLGSRLFRLHFRLTVGRLRGPVHVGTIGGSVTHIGAVVHRGRVGSDGGTWFGKNGTE